MLLVLIIPGALVFMYGKMVGSRRQALAIFATMFVMFFGAVVVAYAAEAHGSPAQHAAGLVTAASREHHRRQHGGQGAALRHRRLRAVRRRHDRHLVRRRQQLDRVLHGARRRGTDGQPVGERGDLRRRRHRPVLDPALRPARGLHRRADGRAHARVPRQEDRGQGDQAGRARGADHAADGAVLHRARDRQPRRAGSISSDGVGPQGFSETFYAYLSQANNNGSAFAGYTGFVQPNAGNMGSHGVTFADLLGSFDMLFARYAPILFALAVAGALAGKRVSPAGLGTMRTDNPTFVVLLIGVIVLVGALTFFPALLLGPIVQALTPHLY